MDEEKEKFFLESWQNSDDKKNPIAMGVSPARPPAREAKKSCDDFGLTSKLHAEAFLLYVCSVQYGTYLVLSTFPLTNIIYFLPRTMRTFVAASDPFPTSQVVLGK